MGKKIKLTIDVKAPEAPAYEPAPPPPAETRGRWNKQDKAPEVPEMSAAEALAEASGLGEERNTIKGFLKFANPETRAALVELAKRTGCRDVEAYAVKLLQERITSVRVQEARRAVRPIYTNDTVSKKYGADLMKAFKGAFPFDQWISLDINQGEIQTFEKHPGNQSKGMLFFPIGKRFEWQDTAGNVTRASVHAFLLGWARPIPELTEIHGPPEAPTEKPKKASRRKG